MASTEEARAKHREYQKKWAAANPDKIRRYKKRWYMKNCEKVCAKQRAQRAARKEELS